MTMAAGIGPPGRAGRRFGRLPRCPLPAPARRSCVAATAVAVGGRLVGEQRLLRTSLRRQRAARRSPRGPPGSARCGSGVGWALRRDGGSGWGSARARPDRARLRARAPDLRLRESVGRAPARGVRAPAWVRPRARVRLGTDRLGRDCSTSLLAASCAGNRTTGAPATARRSWSAMPRSLPERLRRSAGNDRARRSVDRRAHDLLGDHRVGLTVCWFRTSRTHVSRHAGLMSQDIGDSRSSLDHAESLEAMSKARLVITAVTLENRTVAEVVADYGVSKSWVYELLARYRRRGRGRVRTTIATTEDLTERHPSRGRRPGPASCARS